MRLLDYGYFRKKVIHKYIAQIQKIKEYKMKAKIFIITAILLLTISMIVACNNTPRPQITDFMVDSNGNLVIIYSDGSKKTVDDIKLEDGKDGIGISEISLNENGELILTFSDGESQNLGKILGEDGVNGSNGIDGTNGVNGTDGINGTDGVGISNIYLNSNKELIIELTNGDIKNLGKIAEDSATSGSIENAGDHTESGWGNMIIPN